MYLISVPSPFLGFLGSGVFGMVALTYQRGEWDKLLTTSCSNISIVQDNAQEPAEVFDLFGGVFSRITCISLVNACTCDDKLKVFHFKCAVF